MQLKIISAGAGSGKTYRLTQELVQLVEGGMRPSGIIGTTFTNKAASELQERVRTELISRGESAAANDLTNALIGTVHAVGIKLLERFAYEAGVSPKLEIIADADRTLLFSRALSNIQSQEQIERFEFLSRQLGFLDRTDKSSLWKHELQLLTEYARVNNFSAAALRESAEKSWAGLKDLLADENPPELTAAEWNTELKRLLECSIADINANEADTTKVTADARTVLENALKTLNRDEPLTWNEWAKISKSKPGSKSKDCVEALKHFAAQVGAHPQLQAELSSYIFELFDAAGAAIAEYQRYKNERGLIDFTDMEILVDQLLDNTAVQEVLRAELDLLMVDEFQDTSPIQLSIFLKLARLVPQSIWVGDPKQSIYGFRGAEPKLMKGIIDWAGGVLPENIQTNSWRSRPDLVHLANAIFCAAFDDLPEGQVALNPMRKDAAKQKTAINHWHFELDEGKSLNQGWFNRCIVETLQKWLAEKPTILRKHVDAPSPVTPGDVAVLCGTNNHCVAVAAELEAAGFEVAIAQQGLVETSEVRLLQSALKYLIDRRDTLATAELIVFSSSDSLPQMLDNRIQYLLATETDKEEWGLAYDFVRQANTLRSAVQNRSVAEVLPLVIEQLDLRRMVTNWGNGALRISNLEQCCQLAVEYETTCQRMRQGASISGFLLWLQELNRNGDDHQAATTSASAIQVMTYHKSKGLEFPVVICHGLDRKMRDNVFSFSIVNEREELDINDVLGGRWLRLWKHPFGANYRSTPLEERVKAAPEQLAKTAETMAEEARLLYVGTTRARDYLIFPTHQKTGPLWMNRVCNKNEKVPILGTVVGGSPFLWKGKELPVDERTEVQPIDFEMTRRTGLREERYWSPRVGVETFQKEFIDAHKLTLPTSVALTANEVKIGSFEAFKQLDALFARALVHLLYILPRQAIDGQHWEGLLTRFEAPQLDFDALAYRQSFWQTVQRDYPEAVVATSLDFRSSVQSDYRTELPVDVLLRSDEVVLAIAFHTGGLLSATDVLKRYGSWAHTVNSALQPIVPNGKCIVGVHAVGTASIFWIDFASAKSTAQAMLDFS